MHLIILYTFLIAISFNAISAGVFDFLSKEQDQENVTDFFDGHTLNSDNEAKTTAKVIAVNKITASSQVLNVKLNKPIFFYNLEINLHRCVKITNPYKPDSYGLFTLTEYKINDDANVIFKGWLIASSISLSNFDHPIYELFIKECF